MLVFGDHLRVRDPRAVVRELNRLLPEIVMRPAGLNRHAALVGAFIEASELAQGIADAEVGASGLDGRRLVSDLAMSLLVELAHDIAASWTSGFMDGPTVPRSLTALSRVPLPTFVRMRRAEGFAYYAVYPEAYLLAATAAREERPGPRRVIGIRSIGTGLAAMVATALEAPLPATVRPTGDPFRRELLIAPELAAEWTADPDATIAIVDEGPGLSGSSFGAVGDALEDRGVTRIECFPSHAGELGPFATTRHRERWARVPRHVIDVDTLLVHTTSPAHSLATWISDLVGPLTAPLEDISAGAWRDHRYQDERAWPPSVTYQERRKWLAHTAGSDWVAKFVGLGRAGDRALARARTLHTAGFTPEVVGLCHGFLLERWLGRAAVLDPKLFDRRQLVETLGSYLGFRCRTFPASERGASLAKLLEMARRNITLSLGARTANLVDRWTGDLTSLELAVRPIEIDGRLHTWEWLIRDGELVKTDALDHHAAHDLIGCQDVTWDIAGASVELGLSNSEEKRLVSLVSEIADRACDADLLAMARPCYLAFQLGRHALAIDTADAREAMRLRAAVDRYAALIAKC